MLKKTENIKEEKVVNYHRRNCCRSRGRWSCCIQETVYLPWDDIQYILWNTLFTLNTRCQSIKNSPFTSFFKTLFRLHEKAVYKCSIDTNCTDCVLHMIQNVLNRSIYNTIENIISNTYQLPRNISSQYKKEKKCLYIYIYLVFR